MESGDPDFGRDVPPGASGLSDEVDPRPGIAALVARALEDAKAWAQAEIAYAKALFGARMSEAKAGIVLVAAALVVALGALIALFVGLVLTLATVIGPGWATLAVVGLSTIVAYMLARLGLAHFARIRQLPDSDGETP